MRDRAAKLVLPRYNNAGAGTERFSPNGSQVAVEGGGWGGASERGPSILLDIEGGSDEATGMSGGGATWWRTDRITSPIKTAVFTHLGSAMISGWSRARVALLTGSSYIRRVPAPEKPFDLNGITHTGDPSDI